MKFYDFHLHGKSQKADQKLIKEARRLGYAGTSIFYFENDYESAVNYLDKIRADLTGNKKYINQSLPSKSDDFLIIPGLKIQSSNTHDLQKKITRLRNKTNVLMVQGGNLKINRSSCENIKVDILSRPYYQRRDPGINHVLSKEAFKNNVTIEICLNDLLRSRHSLRSKLIAHFRDIINLKRKFNFPLLITSGADSFYDLRNPRDIIALFKCLDMSEEEILTAISHQPQSILKYNLDRKNTVVDGVKVISG